MKRAVVVFVENKRRLLMQLGWLYASLKHIQASDTDLVVFGTKEALQQIPDDCIKIECEKANTPPEVINYPRINSIHYFLNQQIDVLKQYDYILRTDVDTFLTPAWNNFFPNQYTTGKGAYVHKKEVRENLKRVAEVHGLDHRGIHNIGATHYGNPSDVIAVSQQAVVIAKYLLTHDFKDQKGVWPGWYGGVINMYSNEISINHHISNFQIDNQNLDYYSTSSNSIQNHAHIHCWHTNNDFSKFQFDRGAYDSIRIEDLDLDKVKDYCLYIALQAREMKKI